MRMFVVLMSLFFAAPTHAEVMQLDDAEKALKMLMEAVPKVRANAQEAFDLFTAEQRSGINGDLYVACFDMEGKIRTGQRPGTLVQNVSTELFAEGSKEVGHMSVVSYQATRPNRPELVLKISYVMRITEQYACNVGYYPPRATLLEAPNRLVGVLFCPNSVYMVKQGRVLPKIKGRDTIVSC